MARRKAQNGHHAVSPPPASESGKKRRADEMEPVNEIVVGGTPSKRQRRRPEKAVQGGERDDDAYAVPVDKALASESPSADEAPVVTPRKRGRPPKNATPTTNGSATPSGRKRGRPPKNQTPTSNGVVTPSNRKASAQKKLETPSRLTGDLGFTPRRRAAVDRSAKRKSARVLIQQIVGEGASDDEEDGLIRRIYESSESDSEEEDEDEEDEDVEGEEGEADDNTIEVAGAAADTPSKTPARRGRPPKGTSKRKARPKSPTPPRDLPPHELYFEHNKPGRAKTSNNTFASLEVEPLTHDEYFALLKDYEDPHKADLAFLQSLHEGSFGQWSFELSQGFSLCVYGLGSKQALLTKFAEHTYAAIPNHSRHKVVVVNGYVRTLTLREILSTVASALDPEDGPVRLPAQAPSMLQALASQLTDSGTTVTVLINSIDSPALRKLPIQQSLARLASHPHIRLLCSADTPDFSLLWDAGLRASFNFLFHDCTTLIPPTLELDPLDEVHELLGRRARAVNGKEGVIYVLRSLPENAKNLFRLLLAEVLLAIEEEDTAAGRENPAVEYRMMYNKAVEEFVCSSEMAFRTLLKEFHDHQIITSSKDALGTEMLSIPFRKEELEDILEELTS